jgi:hypothetical protein
MKKTIIGILILAVSATAIAQDSMRMNADISGRIAARDMRGATDPPALPVIETFVPQEVVSMVSGKYPNGLYSVKQLRVASGDSAYQVVLVDSTETKLEWLAGDGNIITDIYRVDTGIMATGNPTINNNMNNMDTSMNTRDANLNNNMNRDTMNNMNTMDTSMNNMNRDNMNNMDTSMNNMNRDTMNNMNAMDTSMNNMNVDTMNNMNAVDTSMNNMNVDTMNNMNAVDTSMNNMNRDTMNNMNNQNFGDTATRIDSMNMNGTSLINRIVSRKTALYALKQTNYLDHASFIRRRINYAGNCQDLISS